MEVLSIEGLNTSTFFEVITVFQFLCLSNFFQPFLFVKIFCFAIAYNLDKHW